MATQDAQKLNGINTVSQALMGEHFTGKENDTYKLYTKELPMGSDGKFFEYSFLSALPRVRKWTGDKQFKGTRANTHLIAIEDYESSTSLSKLDWKRNPVARQGINDFFVSHRDFTNQVVVSKLLRSNVDDCYDGQPLCSTAHPYGPGGSTQSNYSTGSLNDVNYEAASIQMRSIKDETGRSMNVVPDLLLIGTALRYTAGDILETQQRVRDSNGAVTDNIFTKDGVRVAVDSEIDGNTNGLGDDASNHWFLIDTKLSPMCQVVAEAWTPSDNVNEFLSQGPVYKFSIEGQMGIGYGLWAGIFGSFAA